MWDTWPYLYSENMVPVEDLAQAVSEEYGRFYDWVVKTASVDGKWYSVPHGTSSIAYAYRISLFEEAGIEDPKNNFPKTYDELFAVGKTLKEMGKPLGQAFGQSLGDPPAFAYPFMWSYGAIEVEEDGTTVAINKPEFVEALQAFTQHWTDAYDETGLSWDDAANNRAFLSDQISATINGSSIYLAAVDAKEGESKLDYEVQVEPDDIWHSAFQKVPLAFQRPRSRSYAAMSYSHFRRLLNVTFGRTVADTLIYSFITVPFDSCLGLALVLAIETFALAGSSGPVFSSSIVPTAISSLAWLMLFDPILSPISWALKGVGRYLDEHQLPRRSLARHRRRLRRQRLARSAFLRHLHPGRPAGRGAGAS